MPPRKTIHLPSTAVWLVLGALISACAAPRITTLPPPTAFNPAGEWEYVERGQSVLLKLDAEGNGGYPWQDGRIITTAIEGGTWRGLWQQLGNDREGGFELTLSPDQRRADGRWWYTRIGDDTRPEKKGGKFSLIRVPEAGGRQAGADDR